jgi:hypothetical protein
MESQAIRISIINFSRSIGVYSLLRLFKNFRNTKRDSYSQTGEDILIKHYFDDEDFTYIDIGAGEPIIGSNTYLFYRSGRHGILVDPLRSNHLLTKILRPRDKAVCTLIGLGSVPLKFWEFEAYEYSTMDKQVASRILEEGKIKLKKVKNLEVMTLAEIVELLPNRELPWFLSIDVEGSDLEVLKSFDFRNSRPRVICIEDHAFIQNKFSTQHEYMTSLGYGLVNKTSISLIYKDQFHGIKSGL